MSVKDWSTTAGSNTGILSGITLDGSVMTVPQVDDAFRDLAAQVAQQLGDVGFEGADIASATTTDLANATGWSLDITGTTTITGFGTVNAGQLYILRFTGALILTHNATSLILPGAANIATVANDVAIMKSEGGGNWRCIGYQRASGGALRAGTIGTVVTATSGSEIDFTVPTGTRKVTLTLASVSTNGTNNLAVSLGDSGGIEASGYAGAVSRLEAGATSTSFSSSFALATGVDAADAISGVVTLAITNPSTNVWSYSATVAQASTAMVCVGAGAKTLSGELTTVRLATADTFDTGNVNIIYE